MHINGCLLRISRLRKVLLGKDFYQSRQVHKQRLRLGNRYADWTFCPNGLDENSIILSVGAGRDISFDLGLIRKYKCNVHVFDPSPESVEWIKRQELPGQFHFHPSGLSDRDGYVYFMPPESQAYESLRIIGEKKHQGKTFHLQVHKLASIIEKLAINKIEILKMDIEGEEYSVIDDIISSPVEIRQLLIEFHHRFEDHSVNDTKDAINKLNSAGYYIFHVADNGEEISFIHE